MTFTLDISGIRKFVTAYFLREGNPRVASVFLETSTVCLKLNGYTKAAHKLTYQPVYEPIDHEPHNQLHKASRGTRVRPQTYLCDVITPCILAIHLIPIGNTVSKGKRVYGTFLVMTFLNLFSRLSKDIFP